jgi:hypothetical protein
MPRSAVTVATLTAYNDKVAITKDAIDIANDHSISVDGVRDGNLTIFIETTNAVAATFTFKAGDFSGASVGDYVVSTSSAATNVIQLESARFKDSDNLILIDIVSTGVTGNIYAVEAL